MAINVLYFLHSFIASTRSKDFLAFQPKVIDAFRHLLKLYSYFWKS